MPRFRHSRTLGYYFDLPDDNDTLEAYDPKAWTPEMRMWGAVLEKAWRDLTKRKHRVYALEWFGYDGDEMGSFWWVCQVVSPTPDKFFTRIRTRVEQLYGPWGGCNIH